jgi:hypothetical protein
LDVKKVLIGAVAIEVGRAHHATHVVVIFVVVVVELIDEVVARVVARDGLCALARGIATDVIITDKRHPRIHADSIADEDDAVHFVVLDGELERRRAAGQRDFDERRRRGRRRRGRWR